MSHPERAAAAAAPIVAAVAALLAWTLLAGGGDRAVRLAWIGGAAVVVAGSLVVLTLLGALPRPLLDRPALLAIAAFVGLALWQTLAYLAFLGLGIAVASVVPRAPRLAANVLAALIGTTCAVALTGKVFAGLVD